MDLQPSLNVLVSQELHLICVYLYVYIFHVDIQGCSHLECNLESFLDFYTDAFMEEIYHVLGCLPEIKWDNFLEYITKSCCLGSGSGWED